jgi:hypothetical protein
MMGIKNTLAFGLALALVQHAPAQSQAVEVGEGDWRNIPFLTGNRTVNLGIGAMERVDKIVAAGKCRAIGRRDTIKLLMPFIVEFNPDKSVARLVIKRIGCPEVEQIAASAAVHAAKTGRVVSDGKNDAGWYRGEVSYILE